MTPDEEKVKNLDRLLGVLVMSLENIADLVGKSKDFARTGNPEDLLVILEGLSKSCFAAAVTSKNASVIIKEELES